MLSLGAHAEVGDFQSGALGRKHAIDLMVTLADDQVLTWHEMAGRDRPVPAQRGGQLRRSDQHDGSGEFGPY
jgi:hypothetical protein